MITTDQDAAESAVKQPLFDPFLYEERGGAIDRMPFADRSEIEFHTRPVKADALCVFVKMDVAHSRDGKGRGNFVGGRNPSLAAALPPECDQVARRGIERTRGLAADIAGQQEEPEQGRFDGKGFDAAR